MEDPFVLKFDGPRNGPSKPWETFPKFVKWVSLSTGKDASDGLLGIRAALAASGMVGLLGHHIQAATQPDSDPAIVRHWITNECGRLMMAVTQMAESCCDNPLRNLEGPANQYVVPYNVAYKIPDKIDWRDRAPIWMNLYVRIASHILPIGYAMGMDAFTADSGFMPEVAAQEILGCVHEVNTLLDSFGVTMSACLENQVRSCLSDNIGIPIDDS